MRKVIYYILIGMFIVIVLLVFAVNSNKQVSETDEQKGIADLENISNNDTDFNETFLSLTDEEKTINKSVSGRWVWEKNSEEYTFTIDIVKVDDHYIGTYFAVAESGMKIDGDIEDTPSFKIENFINNETVVDFKTYYSDTVGKVKLRLENDKLYWEIVEEPKGIYFCPNFAILLRSSE